ncbi:MAG TPA: DegV family protein [Acidimicrobiales bacterium]
MPGIRVVTDSACDLPPQLVKEHGIDVVALSVRFGEEELREELSPAEFWARCARSDVLPSTAAPSAGAFQAAFERAADDGCPGVVCINLSSELSATYQAACNAAGALGGTIPARVIDSRSLTIAQGLMCISAAQLADQGKGIDEVAAAVEDLIPRTRIFGALDTLENLKRGGRIGAASAFMGSLLSIKPIIEVADGKVEPESRQRTRARSLRYLVDKVRSFPEIELLAVMHGEAPDVGEILDMLAEIHPREDIIVGDVGPVIGTHAGPRVIGVAFQVGAPAPADRDPPPAHPG